MLLVGAGLMTKGLARLINREQNVQPDTLLTLRINLPASKYGDSRKAVDFYSQLLARVTNLPGVASAAIANVIPHSGTNAAITAFKREGTPEVEPGEQNLCEYASISPGYMRTVRIALRQGRGFIDSDGANAPAVALISERLARRFWPGEDPLGKRVSIGRASSFGPGMTIVGVVADVVQNSFDREARFVIYVPYAQDPLTNMHLAVRTYGDPSAVVNAIEAQVQGLDREQPVYQVKTLGRLMDDQVTGLRYIAVLMSIFGGLALLLASVGVYGVMSYAVSERTREIGVRIALGARKRDVLALVVGRGMLIALAGVSTGLAGAFALARVLSGLIFGISSTDAPTFAGVALLLTVVTLVASYVPARRATRVDPITALRYE